MKVENMTSRNWLLSGLFMAVLSTAALFVPASIGKAAPVNWADSAATSDWFASTNWIRTPAGYPTAGDSIYIGNNTTGAARSGDVVIGSGGAAAGSTLQIGYTPGTTGSLTVQSGASLTLSGSATLGQQGSGS